MEDPHIAVNSSLLEAVASLAREVGITIMRAYNRPDHGVVVKTDNSPQTSADLAAHRILLRCLRGLGGLPVVSEEGSVPSWEERKTWKRHWLIDPLDGTREFMARRPEFTVNIALIENEVAVLGIVLLPVSGDLYGGLRVGSDRCQWRAFHENLQGARRELRTRTLSKHSLGAEVQVVVSRRDNQAKVESVKHWLENYFTTIRVHYVPGALKFCRIAEGFVDLLPRFATTAEWDTAAGQAIVEAAGGGVFDLNGNPLRYNCKKSLMNPPFYAVGDINSTVWRRCFPVPVFTY